VTLTGPPHVNEGSNEEEVEDKVAADGCCSHRRDLSGCRNLAD
jgi:hypothetical protein